MRTLRVHDVLKERILVTRESARLLEDALRAAIADARTLRKQEGNASVIIDFSGVEGVTPSFLDELLSAFESLVGPESNDCERSLIVANPPTRLSLKFHAIARGHRMSVQAMPDGSWLLTGHRNPAA